MDYFSWKANDENMKGETDGEGPRNAVEIPDVAQASEEMRKHWEQIQENMIKNFSSTLPFGNGGMPGAFPMSPVSKIFHFVVGSFRTTPVLNFA